MYDSIVRALDCIVTHRYLIYILYWYIFINISGNESDWITILTYSFVEVWVNSITQYFKTYYSTNDFLSLHRFRLCSGYGGRNSFFFVVYFIIIY